jgi:hypothetical protein
MATNQELLNRIEASAEDWGPTGRLGNDVAFATGGVEDGKLSERLGLHPISIRFPKDLVSDLKAIAQINGMSYQPLIREVCQRFVDAEKRAFITDQTLRRAQEAQEAERQRKLAEDAAASALAVEKAQAVTLEQQQAA